MSEQEKDIPDNYQGTLESNFYCRAWNSKREKYCGNRAGKNTDHKGIGRCWIHDGKHKSTEDQPYSKYHPQAVLQNMSPAERYNSLPKTLQDLYEGQANDTDPLNVEADIALARTILIDYVQRYDEARASLDEWYDWYVDETGSTPPKVDLLPVEHVVTFLKKVTDIAHKERKLRMADAVSISELNRIMNKMAKVVEHWVTHQDMADEEKLKRIKEDWLQIDLGR